MTNLRYTLATAALALLLVPVGAQDLLPKPQKTTAGKGFFAMTGTPVKVMNHTGDNAVNIYSESFLKSADASSKRIALFCALPGAHSPEAYSIHVTPDTLHVSASTKVGFIRAWQTLAQLTTEKGIACCDISDEPAYEWRGLMLDVSRHFFPLSHIKKQIDVMARYKFNRLHLHLTDAAGWRMEIKRYPRLTSFAAWRPEETWKEWTKNGGRYCEEGTDGAHGGYYTQDELRSLVAYAAERGIMIVPEIEMPAHSEEVLTAYPELSCTHEPYKQSDFCPGSVATYDFLENVLKEVMDVFPSPYIHVGGDEASKASWGSCPLCRKKMHELGIDNIDGLQANLIAHMGKFLASHGRQLVGWDEVTAGNLTENTTVMVWRGTEYAHEAIKHGYNVVMSPGAYCYFDSYQDDPHTQRAAIGGYLPLEKVYSYVPGGDLPENERRKITGIQANLWAEYIPTCEHAESMLYPRAFAIAEIGWNGTKTKNYPEFRQRALQQIEVLRKAGVSTFDLKNEAGERRLAKTGVKNKALGAKVTYNKPYHEKYRADGDVSLVDGKCGGWAFGGGGWQGFIGDDCFDITIDMGKVKSISSVAADFTQSCGAEIYFPSNYAVQLSTDGTNFTDAFNQNYESAKTDLPEMRMYTWKGSAKARYIRVKAKPSAFGGWIFCDEVIVK